MLDFGKKLQEVKEQMLAAQEALALERVVGTSGNGMVKVTVSGDQKVISIEIDPQLLVVDKQEMLKELLTGALNQAISQAQEMARKRVGAITSGLIPGL